MTVNRRQGAVASYDRVSTPFRLKTKPGAAGLVCDIRDVQTLMHFLGSGRNAGANSAACIRQNYIDRRKDENSTKRWTMQ